MTSIFIYLEKWPLKLTIDIIYTHFVNVFINCIVWHYLYDI